MPQITQLPFIFASQLFWLAVVFGLIFFVVGRGMLPKIQSTVDAREKKIADDLARAQAARAAAEDTEAAWRARMDAARADAGRIAQEAKQDSARKTEAKVRKAADKIALICSDAKGKDDYSLSIDLDRKLASFHMSDLPDADGIPVTRVTENYVWFQNKAVAGIYSQGKLDRITGSLHFFHRHLNKRM